MKLAIKAYFVTLILLMLVFAVPAQKLSDKDDRNTAPTVGTGGPVGGPTGLFTVYDGHTLRKGEYTFSAAYSNYDRDPGNADFTSVPLSFQIGVTNKLELFFTTEAFRGVKINSPRNLSGFYLPNSQLPINGVLTSPPAIVLAPGTGGSFFNTPVFRPQGAPFSQFPFTGGNAGTFGFNFPFFSGPAFGFPAGTNALLGPPRGGGNASFFPGVGSVFGSILPGIVLQTAPLACAVGGTSCGTQPTSFTVAPTFLGDAPFINRRYGTSAFNSYDVGFKWRANSVESAVGYGVLASYRFYTDNANSASGFNQLQRGAGPGANRGDFNVTGFIDGRLAKWANLSANAGYTYTSNPTGNFGGTKFTLLDRPDELNLAIGADFPVNRYFQPILELRYLRYIRHQTPNALEQDPLDGIAGVRVYPRRWFGFGVAYRYNFNQQDSGSFSKFVSSNTVTTVCGPVSIGNCVPGPITNSVRGVPSGLVPSTDPHGYIGQFWVGRRNTRAGEVVNKPANVDSVDLSATVITLPCRPGYRSTSGSCNDSVKTISVTTHASDPENDVLTYNYTVSGGRVVGTGANVQWDLSSAQVGTYTITTGVDDGCGVCGKTDTRTIKVQECPDCVVISTCSCPPLSVSGPSGVTNPGDAMTFTASAGGDVTYNWSVSAGTIESGQGTPSISVRTTPDMAGSNVTATVKIGGTDPACNCDTTKSETAPVAAKIGASVIDEFGKATDDDVKARVDGFYTQLNNNPNAQGYIINYGTPAQIKKRRAQIMKAINFRKYDVSRVTFVDGPDNGTGESTKFYLVPAGADKPTP